MGYNNETGKDDVAMQETKDSLKEVSRKVDAFGMLIIVVLALVALGTVGMLFSSRRGKPETQRYAQDLQKMEKTLQYFMEQNPETPLNTVVLKDLEKGMGKALDRSRYSLGILSEDQGAKIFVGIKLLSDPAVQDFKANPPKKDDPLFWGEKGGIPGTKGGVLRTSLLEFDAISPQQSPQWVYLLAGERPWER